MRKLQLIILSITLFLASPGFAQLITLDPTFPTDQDAVIVTFNAALGSGGLEGYSGDVYAHTGVITNNSNSGSDWKYVKAAWNENIPECKMTNKGGDIWELNISPSIREYYGVPEGESILQLAFVFRSADGSLEGKTESGGDIFYDVSQAGIQVLITLPEENQLIVETDDIIHIEGSSTDADSTFLYNNETLLYAGTQANFQYDLTVTASGLNYVKAVAKNATQMVVDSFSYYNRPAVVIEDVPDGIIDGINYIDDNTVILCLYAPMKNYVFAIGDFSNWEINDDVYMKRSSDGSRYWVQLNNLEAGKEYIYQYFIDGNLRVGDPYADKVSDPWNDQYISSATYPDLIEYPSGKTSGIATVFQTAQTPYEWQIPDFSAPDHENLIIYELLIRDFTDDHDFQSLIDTLNYLDRLGVNAIELMPVNEFEGNLSWGYNPNYYFAVDKYYGPKDSFKSFIDAAHERGIAVIMDMVLNHAYNSCPLVMMYWDSQNNRPAGNNPWFNVESPNNAYSWGSDFNHESQATKDFVDRVNKYWLEEYNIDGFRFDFTKGFTNTPGDGGGYDQSRIDILKRMSNVLWESNPDAYVILEHFADNSEEKVLVNNGMMIWGNINYNYNEATMGWNDNSNFSWVSYQERNFSSPNLVGYMESHDEERLMFKNKEYGNSNGTDYNVKSLGTGLERNGMAAAFFITIPGPKMIWQFGELGYDYSINTCEDGSIDESCRVAPKPIRWDYFENWQRAKLFYVYQALIELKKNEAAFSTNDYSLSLSGATKSIHLNHDDMDVTIIGNFGVNTESINPNFQQTGTWYDYYTGNSIEVNNTSSTIDLEAGEYHIYTTKQLDTPQVLGIKNIDDESNMRINIYPNPANNMININFLDDNYSKSTIELYNIEGKLMKSLYTVQKNNNISVNDISNGIYMLKINTLFNIYSKKVLIN
ncbi:MAG: alpha-amylase [Marinilabiliales bacterium]|nr:MAG: alpha-amylase [Marinilabiliales bacterium]